MVELWSSDARAIVFRSFGQFPFYRHILTELHTHLIALDLLGAQLSAHTSRCVCLCVCHGVICDSNNSARTEYVKLSEQNKKLLF